MFECVFCSDCVTSVYEGRCPNCGGNFQQRPIRRLNLLDTYPASAERVIRG